MIVSDTERNTMKRISLPIWNLRAWKIDSNMAYDWVLRNLKKNIKNAKTAKIIKYTYIIMYYRKSLWNSIHVCSAWKIILSCK